MNLLFMLFMFFSFRKEKCGGFCNHFFSMPFEDVTKQCRHTEYMVRYYNNEVRGCSGVFVSAKKVYVLYAFYYIQYTYANPRASLTFL